MNVIITKSFLNNFRKDFRKYNFSLTDLVNGLIDTKKIKLKQPYNKVKLKLNWVDIRWIVLINLWRKILPIYLVLKKDKKYWENLIINKETVKVLEKTSVDINNDLLNWDYIEY